MKILVTGGAGFIGSNLMKTLHEQGHDIVCVDNFTLGKKENLTYFDGKDRFCLEEFDASDIEKLNSLVSKFLPDMIYHLAANSDIQKSSRQPNVDFDNTFLTTYSVLETMRRNNIKKLFFASTSAIYGNMTGINITEQQGGLSPISYYGGAKLASEAFISSYAYMNNFDVTIFRFPNVIGSHLTHGVIFDFIKKLKNNPSELEILGDGTQSKPYIYIDDLIDAILLISMNGETGLQIYNVGVEGKTTVKRIADMVCEIMNLSHVQYKFTGGNIGWKGDVPSFQYDLTKIHKKGWKAKLTSDEAVKATLATVLMESGNVE